MKTSNTLQREPVSRNADEDLVELPLRVPRSALVIVERPLRVTQRTSERVLGIPPRAFLALAREFERAGGDVITIGKLRSCAVEPLEAWLRTRSGAAPVPEAPRTYAEELGLRVVVGGRK